ncbi:Fructosamine kinase-domain-containing protein [Xylariaceae sp. FL0255]|nr:Fructosamine kinase-domain-containing protein [Xylariaceae sp. FL0255]
MAKTVLSLSKIDVFPVGLKSDPDRAVLKLDSAVRHLLEPNETIISVIPYGNANWATTAKIITRTIDHAVKEYFLKTVTGELAQERVLAELTCMSDLYHAVPDIVPRPYSAGRCFDRDGYYFLSEYVPITLGMPDAVQLGEEIARLHRVSQSPTGKFGFSITPYDGKLPLVVGWDSSWVSFFGKLLEGAYLLDVKFNGKWPKVDVAIVVILAQVVPRLLGPLEQHGHSVKPCLIHGDLWEDNIGKDINTGGIFIFDCCAYYAHHEMGVAMWRVKHHKMNAPEYRAEYFRNYPPDEPVSEFDDRNRLYSLKESLMYSALKPGHWAREGALHDMEYLINKYVAAKE